MKNNAFDLNQYIVYMMSVLIVEFGRSAKHIILDVLCIGFISFATVLLYFEVVRLCGGYLSYWRCFNVQMCIGTLANIGNLFELKNKTGSIISFCISIYCIYLHIRAVIVMGGALKNRTIVIYMIIFIMVLGGIYVGIAGIMGVLINERGYIG